MSRDASPDGNECVQTRVKDITFLDVHHALDTRRIESVGGGIESRIGYVHEDDRRIASSTLAIVFDLSRAERTETVIEQGECGGIHALIVGVPGTKILPGSSFQRSEKSGHLACSVFISGPASDSDALAQDFTSRVIVANPDQRPPRL